MNFFIGFANCEYTEPVTNFKQLVNGNKYGFFRNSFIPNTNNTIQLSWDHIHFYHGYEFYWWTDVNPSYTKFYVDTVKLEKTRLDNIEYYSFTEYSRDTYVYYIQLQGWLYGRGHGKISKVLKTLKPNYGNYLTFVLVSNFPVGTRRFLDGFFLSKFNLDYLDGFKKSKKHLFKCIFQNAHFRHLV